MPGTGWIVAGEASGPVAAIVADLTAAGHTAVPCVGRFGDDQAVAQAFDATMDAVPSPAGLVVIVEMRPDPMIGDTTLETWTATVSQPLRQAFLLAQRAVDDFMAGGVPGRVVFVLGWPGEARGASEVLESALHSLARSIAKEYGRRGITCNLVVAGDTPDGAARLLELLRFVTAADSSFVNGDVLRSA